MLRIPFVLLGDALLPVHMPMLQVCPDVGYLRPAVVDVASCLGGVRVEEGHQLLLRMPEVMQHIPQGRGRSVILSVGVLLETAGDGGCAQREGPVSGFRPDDGGGVAIAYVDAGGGGLCLVGDVGWLAFQVGSQVHEPQHFDCMVLECRLSPFVHRDGGGFHVADDDCGGEHGHLAVCFGQGLEEGFRGVAEGDVGVDDVELSSVPDDLLDA